MKITVNKVASAGLGLLAAAAYAIRAGHYIVGAVAACVGIIAITPAALRFVEGRKIERRLDRMGK